REGDGGAGASGCRPRAWEGSMAVADGGGSCPSRVRLLYPRGMKTQSLRPIGACRPSLLALSACGHDWDALDPALGGTTSGTGAASAGTAGSNSASGGGGSAGAGATGGSGGAGATAGT